MGRFWSWSFDQLRNIGESVNALCCVRLPLGVTLMLLIFACTLGGVVEHYKIARYETEKTYYKRRIEMYESFLSSQDRRYEELMARHKETSGQFHAFVESRMKTERKVSQ